MDPIDSLLRLQETMAPDEWRRCSDVAQVVANYLTCHPRLAEVRYPGLTHDRDFPRAATTLRGGFGPLVSYRMVGEDAWQLLDLREASDAHAAVLLLEAAL